MKAPKQSKMEKCKTHLLHPDQDGPSTQGSGQTDEALYELCV